MEKLKVVMNNRNITVPALVIECSSPPCYAHEVDPIYMGLVQPESQGHDVLAIEKVGANSDETLEEVSYSGLVSSS
jgi:hypothetical protein